MFANFASEWLNMPFPSIICIKNTYQGSMFASFEGHTKVTNIPLQDLCFCQPFFFLVHISLGLSRPLRTALELKNWSEDVKKPAGCDCANGKCYWFAKKTKNIKTNSRSFPTKSENSKMSKKWGWGLYIQSEMRCSILFTRFSLVKVLVTTCGASTSTLGGTGWLGSDHGSLVP